MRLGLSATLRIFNFGNSNMAIGNSFRSEQLYSLSNLKEEKLTKKWGMEELMSTSERSSSSSRVKFCIRFSMLGV